MTQAQQIFEAMMRAKGHDDFAKTKTGRYVVMNMQSRWLYFRSGWEMAKVNK